MGRKYIFAMEECAGIVHFAILVESKKIRNMSLVDKNNLGFLCCILSLVQEKEALISQMVFQDSNTTPSLD